MLKCGVNRKKHSRISFWISHSIWGTKLWVSALFGRAWSPPPPPPLHTVIVSDKASAMSAVASLQESPVCCIVDYTVVSLDWKVQCVTLFASLMWHFTKIYDGPHDLQDLYQVKEILKQKSPGRPWTLERNVEHIQILCTFSPNKSLALILNLVQVQNVLHKCLTLLAYNIQWSHDVKNTGVLRGVSCVDFMLN
jgi:hypothetical protein